LRKHLDDDAAQVHIMFNLIFMYILDYKT